MIKLPNLDEWKIIGKNKKIEIIKDFEKKIGNIVFDLTTTNDIAPRFIKKINGESIFFRLILSHSYYRGLTEDNENKLYTISNTPPITIDEMRPIIFETVDAFLISEKPLTNRNITKLMDIKSNENPCFPAYQEYSQFERIVKLFNIEFPSELQWECAIRGNESTLFPFGDNLTPSIALDAWMDFNLCSDNLPQNKFGLKGLFFGEWCQDDFKINLSKSAETLEGSKTIRGGGAYFWPWQDLEWVWCISAMRMPSIDLDNGVAVFRPVINFS